LAVTLTPMPMDLLLLAALSAQTPPPIRTATGERQFLQWVAEDARCGGEPVAAKILRTPANALVASHMPTALQPIMVEFRLDASGRPLSIRRTGTGFSAFSDDVLPALAASTFEVAGQRSGCLITYRPQQSAYADAPVAALIDYSLRPTAGQLPRAAWARIEGEGANCADEPRPQLLRRTYPDFKQIAGSAGNRDWAMVRYDLDASGRPVDARIEHDSGNAELNRASVQAVRDSRFYDGARTGCTYPYWRNPEILAAPEAPQVASFRSSDATCPLHEPWQNQLSLTFPPAFRQRAIEGWAVIGFDTAPWGATGNVRVLASEPAAEFGDRAAGIVRAGRKAENRQGYVGCVVLVRFKMSQEPGVMDLESGESFRVR